MRDRVQNIRLAVIGLSLTGALAGASFALPAQAAAAPSKDATVKVTATKVKSKPKAKATATKVKSKRKTPAASTGSFTQVVSARTDMVHASLRFDRSVNTARSVVRKYRESASIVTLTEIAGRPSVYKQDNWSQVIGNDSAVTWDQRVWKSVGTNTQVYEGVWRGRRDRLGVPMVTLENRVTKIRLLVAAVHTPAGVEGSWSRPSGAVDTHKFITNKVADTAEAFAKKTKADALAVGADWNLNYHRDWVRSYLNNTFNGWKYQWSLNRPNSGTHRGGRLIDGVVARGVKFNKSYILPETAASDHRATSTTFTITKTITRKPTSVK